MKRSHKWDPKNPAAPVISMVLDINSSIIYKGKKILFQDWLKRFLSLKHLRKIMIIIYTDIKIGKQPHSKGYYLIQFIIHSFDS